MPESFNGEIARIVCFQWWKLFMLEVIKNDLKLHE